MGVFNTIATALSGKPAPQPNAGTGRVGPAGPPVPHLAHDRLNAEAAAQVKGIQNVMGAHADMVHPVPKSGGA